MKKQGTREIKKTKKQKKNKKTKKQKRTKKKKHSNKQVKQEPYYISKICNGSLYRQSVRLFKLEK